MFGRLGLSIGLHPVLAREREDGQWQQVVLDGEGETDVEVGGEEVEKLVDDTSSLTLVLEVTQEMKTRKSAFSRNKASAIYGPNYVTTSLLPAQYKSSTTIMQPLTPQRVRRELVNGFSLRGSRVDVTKQYLMHLLNWRRNVSELDLGEGVFSLVVVPRKVKGDMRRVVEEELVAKLPSNRCAVLPGWGERLSTTWRGEKADTILRKIDKKEEVLIVQINLNKLESCAEWEKAK